MTPAFERFKTMLATNTPWRYWRPVGGQSHAAMVQVVANASNGTQSTGTP